MCSKRNTAYLLGRGAKLISIACSAAGAGYQAARESPPNAGWRWSP